MDLPEVHVVAGVLIQNGLVLCCQKGETNSEHTSFKFEFPGGKIQTGETPEEALKRELKEELELDIEILEDLGSTEHRYTHLHVKLHFFLCKDDVHYPVLKEHHSLRWLAPSELHTLDWAAADLPMVNLLETRSF